MMPRRVGAVAAAPWHSSQTESKISAPALTSPETAVPVDVAAAGEDWAIAFQARIELAAQIAVSKEAAVSDLLAVNMQLAP